MKKLIFLFSILAASFVFGADEFTIPTESVTLNKAKIDNIYLDFATNQVVVTTIKGYLDESTFIPKGKGNTYKITKAEAQANYPDLLTAVVNLRAELKTAIIDKYNP